jgi:hypothetical protein
LSRLPLLAALPPSALPAVDCHKIVLQLEEKKIPYLIEKINMRCYGDKPPEFMRKVQAARCSSADTREPGPTPLAPIFFCCLVVCLLPVSALRTVLP